jgi:large subunit ribosomal protein L9
MKVLLLKDVYKLGRAGDVKRVADGYGRNYLLPQGLAVLATSGALKQAEHIRARADIQRSVINKEMSGIAEKLQGITVTFPAKASETGKLYGSITTQMIAEAVSEKAGVEVNRRQIEGQPLRTLGEHTVEVRLTVDLIPTIDVIVHREGEAVSTALEAAQAGEESTEMEDLESEVLEELEELEEPEEMEVLEEMEELEKLDEADSGEEMPGDEVELTEEA